MVDIVGKFYVYCHRRDDTGRVFYIGKGKNGRAYSTRNRNKHWKNITTKTTYTVEFLSVNMVEEDSIELEVFLISEYRRYGVILVNMTLGGEGISGFHHSIETKARLSLLNKGKLSSRKGIPLTQEHKDKLSKARTGRTDTQETKDKKRVASTGKRHSQGTKDRISLASSGRVHSDESRKKMKGRVTTDENKLKFSIARKGRPLSDVTKEKLRQVWVDRRNKRESSI